MRALRDRGVGGSSSAGSAVQGAHRESGLIPRAAQCHFLIVSIPEIGIRVMAVLAFMLIDPTRNIIGSGLGRLDVILNVSAVWRS